MFPLLKRSATPSDLVDGDARKHGFGRFVAAEVGATMAEYGLMLALIAAVLILTVGQLGTMTAAKLQLAVAGFADAGPADAGPPMPQ